MSPLSFAAEPLPELREAASLHAVATPRPARSVARMALVVFLVAGLALAVVPWQQTAMGKGRVIGFAPLDRQQAIEAPVDGRVAHWHVREGSVVRRGDPLVDLIDVDPGLVGRIAREADALRARVAAAEARAASLDVRASSLGSAREQALTGAGARRQMAADRTRGAGEALAAAEAARTTARLNLARQRKLENRGLAAVRARELAELDLARAATDRERAVAALAAARSEELALVADVGRAGADGGAAVADARASRASALAEAASGRAELARIETRLSRQQAQAVTAPRDGVVLRLSAFQDGEIVKVGDPLAVLVPTAGRHAVEIWLTGNDAPLVEPGRLVRLQFEGWPAIQFAGWPSVAVGTFGGEVSFVDATDDGEGRFRAVVVPSPREPWPEPRYLRQGVRANGWVLLNQVSLGFELWRQFNGFPPAIDGKAVEEKGEEPTKLNAPAKRFRK